MLDVGKMRRIFSVALHVNGCTDVNECDQVGVCPPPGTCINTMGSFKCIVGDFFLTF